MEYKVKKSLSVFTALVLAVCLIMSLPLSASADSEMISGSCGTDAEYKLYSDNVLVIAGTGAISDYTASGTDTNAPWAPYYPYSAMKFMQKVVIANDITRIGNYAFYMNPSNSYKVDLINLPDSLEEIGNYAFCNEKLITDITIGQYVTSIGVHAFDGCSALTTVNCYANPANLSWDLSQSGLSGDYKIHVKSNYLTAYQTLYPDYSDKFVGDLSEPTNAVPAGKNILVSYDVPSPNIFGGCQPYSIKSVNSNGVWPVTYGARGFVTCIKVGGEYYALTDNNAGTLSLLDIDSTNGRALRALDTTTYTQASLKVSHEYIGANSVKIIYTVKNNTDSALSFLMGSSGDIKIGLDDKAAITPLSNEQGGIGITMTSSLARDKVDGKSPTLGFAGKQVGGSSGESDFFYGKVGASKNAAATAVKSDIFMPERVFTMNTAEGDYKSKTTGELTDTDSGLSFYWTVSLEANKEKQYSVIFSVPNTSTGEESSTVIHEVESNIGTNTTGTYTTAGGKTVYFNNEVIPRGDDSLAAANGYGSLSNFLILGVMKKPEAQSRHDIRFISVVNTDILRDADEYGYIVVKSPVSNGHTAVRNHMDQVEYNSPNIYKKNIKGTSNEVSGEYGRYDTDTSYKYITVGINDVPDDKVIAVRFYVKKGDTVSYAHYYALNDSTAYDGCAASYDVL